MGLAPPDAHVSAFPHCEAMVHVAGMALSWQLAVSVAPEPVQVPAEPHWGVQLLFAVVLTHLLPGQSASFMHTQVLVALAHWAVPGHWLKRPHADTAQVFGRTQVTASSAVEVTEQSAVEVQTAAAMGMQLAPSPVPVPVQFAATGQFAPDLMHLPLAHSESCEHWQVGVAPPLQICPATGHVMTGGEGWHVSTWAPPDLTQLLVVPELAVQNAGWPARVQSAASFAPEPVQGPPPKQLKRLSKPQTHKLVPGQSLSLEQVEDPEGAHFDGDVHAVPVVPQLPFVRHASTAPTPPQSVLL